MIQRFALLLLLALIISFGGFMLSQTVFSNVPSVPNGAQPIHYDTPLTIQTINGPVNLKVQLAVSDYEQETGMMFRTEIGKDQGMLFVFPDAAPRAFWMKNTLIPLDLIFIGGKNEIVSISRNAIPRDETALPSMVPAKYVLEVGGGQADRWQLKVGDMLVSPALQ